VKLTKGEHDTCQRLTNAMFRELAFYDHHREDEQFDQADDALMTLEELVSEQSRIFARAAKRDAREGAV